MTRVLLSAYSCGPEEGSEPGAGYALVRAASEIGSCWVLTRGNNVDSLEDALADDPTRHPVTVVGVDGPGWTLALKRRFGAVRAYYALWQLYAARRARTLDRELGGFDVVHHATMSAFWLPVGIAGLGHPLVVGPISGGTFTPRTLLRYLGPRGLIEDGVRFAAAHLSAWRARRTLRAAQVVIAQNREMERFASRRLAIGDEHLLRHSHASNPRLDGPHPAESRERTVLFVGRIVSWKGVMLALEAFAKAALEGAQFVIIGSGPQAGALRERAEKLGVGASVVFTGPLDRDEVLMRMRTASCLLFPSFHDSAGFVVSEALTLGLPVVCLDHGGPGELVRLWPTESVAVPPGRSRKVVASLAEAVRDFVEDPRPIPATLVRSTSSLTDVIREAYGKALGGRNL